MLKASIPSLPIIIITDYVPEASWLAEVRLGFEASAEGFEDVFGEEVSSVGRVVDDQGGTQDAS